MTLRALTAALVALCSLRAGADDGLAVKGQLEWFTAARGLLPTEGSLVNQDNEALKLPQLGLSMELRPNLQADWGRWLTAVARPRLVGRLEKTYSGGSWDGGAGAAEVSVTELYATWRASDAVAFTWGLQNFQWGPGELMSPSNRLFHQTGLMRDPLFLVRGRHLVRANVSVGKSFSAVALVELTPNGEAPFVARERFGPSAQVKLEYAADDGRWLAGVTGHASTRARPSFGEYGQVQLTDAVALFVDASHAFERQSWYPGALGWEKRERDGELTSTVLAGARYTFEGGAEARVEYLYTQGGWRRGDFDASARLVRATGDLEPWLAPGLEFLGQHLVYLSLRLPELPPKRRLSVQARVLYSSTDDSAAGFLTASLEATDSLVAFLSLYAALGGPHDELTRFTRGAAVLGAVHTW